MAKHWNTLKRADLQKLFAAQDKKFFLSRLFKVMYFVADDPHVSSIACILSRRKVKTSVKRHLCYRLWKSQLAHHRGLTIVICGTSQTNQANKEELKLAIAAFFQYLETKT